MKWKLFSMSFVRRVEKLKDQLICFQWMFQYQRDVIKVASTKAFGTHESNRFHSIDHCTRNTYHKQKNVRNAEIITPFQALIRQIWSSLRASLIDGEQPVTMILSPSQDNPFCLQSLTDSHSVGCRKFSEYANIHLYSWMHCYTLQWTKIQN